MLFIKSSRSLLVGICLDFESGIYSGSGGATTGGSCGGITIGLRAIWGIFLGKGFLKIRGFFVTNIDARPLNFAKSFENILVKTISPILRKDISSKILTS